VRVLTVGDSFTYGDELTDVKQAWPYVLQTNLSCELTNLGQSGVGNTSMVRTIVEQAADYDLIIVAWSHFARIEFADEHGIFDTWPGHRGVLFTGEVEYRTKLLSYITHHHDDEYLYNQYLMNIVLLQSYAMHHNKKLLMLDAYGNNHFLRWIPKFNYLRDQINPAYCMGWVGLGEKSSNWVGNTMSEWTFGTPQGPGGHFLEEGHAIVADKVYEHIRSLGWI
jgi:hypothetical protein